MKKILPHVIWSRYGVWGMIVIPHTTEIKARRLGILDKIELVSKKKKEEKGGGGKEVLVRC